MITWRDAVVDSVGEGWSGATELTVRLADGEKLNALAYPAISGQPRAGQRVLVTTGPLDKGLGTGGLAFVVVAPDELPAEPPRTAEHLVKARFTPLQQLVLGVDDQESVHHESLRDAEDLA